MVSLRLLGQPEVYYQGRWLELRPAKPLYLLLYAAYTDNWLDRASLAFFFWPEASEQKSQQNLRRLIHRAKSYEFATALEIEKTRLRWKVPTDVAEFKKALSKQEWSKAVDLYNGKFLDGINPKAEVSFEAWLDQERADLARVWRNAIHKHVETLEQEGKYHEATPLLYQLLQQEPLAEDVLQRYLQSASVVGERESALAAFTTFKQQLKDELDLDPLDETLELIEALQPTNILPTQLRAQKPKSTKQKIPLTVLRPPKLIGREEAVRKIRTASTAAVFIAGEAGIGKSRLMAEVAPNALQLHCKEGLQNIPYYPVIQLIRTLLSKGIKTPDLKHYTDDLARLVPELAPTITPGPADPESGRSRLFEALSLYFEHIVDQEDIETTHVLIDDLQWADASTLDFLFYLTNKKRLKVLGAYRVHEQTDSLKEMIRGLSSSKLLTKVKLEPLSKATVKDFIASMVNQAEGPPLFSEWLSQATGGNPMFILEALKSLFEQGTLEVQKNGGHTDFDKVAKDYSEFQLPTVIQQLIQRRINNLKAETKRILQVASVIHHSFTPQLISQISGLSEWAIVGAFEDAQDAAILRQDRFQHDLLRQSIYLELSPTRRKLLHQRAAQSLDMDAEPGLIAEHWLAGGYPDQAIECWLQASVQLRERGLSLEAINLLKKAESKAVKNEKRWKIMNGLALNYKDLAQQEKAQEIINVIFDHGDDEARAEACAILGGILIQQGKLKQAERVVSKGLQLTKTLGLTKIEMDLLGTAAIIKHAEGDFQDALDLEMPLLERLRQGPPSLQLTISILNVAALLDQVSRHEEALSLHLEALAITKKSGDKARQVDVGSNLLYCYMDLNRTADGVRVAQEALELGHFEGTDMLRNNLAAAYMDMGNFSDAKEHYEILVQTCPHATILCVAWSRLATLYDTDSSIHKALDNAISFAKQTEMLTAHAVMATSVLQLGDKTQVMSVKPYIEQLELEDLPTHIRKKLEQAIAENV